MELCPFGLITDIDGTISPHSPDPIHVTVPETSRRLLERLSHRLDLVAVISGRAAGEIRRMIDGDKILCIGHYGMEWWQGGKVVTDERVQPYIGDVRAVAGQIQPLASLPGVIIQDKELTISVHYRLSPEPEKTKKAILELLAAIPQMKRLHALEENLVVGIIPPVHIHKGTAVANLIRHHNLRAAVYLGDDTADVLAFDAIHRANQGSDFRGLAVAVTGQGTAPGVAEAADYELWGIGETQQMLRQTLAWLVRKLDQGNPNQAAGSVDNPAR
jgi:trehalose 6-phosphate phosphatase